MSDTLITGIFTIAGVFIGSILSFCITVYTENKNHFNSVQEVKKEIIIKKMSHVNNLIKQLPSNNDELESFRNYLVSIYSKEYNEKDNTLEMLYLTEEIMRNFEIIESYVNQDVKEDCDYRNIKRMMVFHRNVLINIIKDELGTRPSSFYIKRRHKKIHKYAKQEMPNLFSDVFAEVEEQDKE